MILSFIMMCQLMFEALNMNLPRSQSLSSSWSGKIRDPGNEVEHERDIILTVTQSREFIVQ